MQPWLRWRAPLAVVLVVALALMLLVRVAAFAVYAGSGAEGGLLGSIPGGDDLLLLTTSAAVLWCATPIPALRPGHRSSGQGDERSAAEPQALSPHAWPIAIAGLVVVGLTVLGWLTLSVLNLIALLRWPTPDTGFVLLGVEGLLRLAVPMVSLVAVILAVLRAGAARAAAREPGRRSLPAAETISQDVEAEPAVPAEPSRLPAAWQADEATGAVWLTADDAAEGRPGLSWSESTPTGAASLSPGWSAAPDGAAPRSGSASPPPVAPPPVAPPPSGGPRDDRADQGTDRRDAAQDDDLR